MEVKVFTLNIWGIGYGLTEDREIRVKAIADYLAQSEYDIVLLQEVWMQSDFQKLKNVFPIAGIPDTGGGILLALDEDVP